MTTDLGQFALYCAILLACAPLLGGYMYRVYSGQAVLLSPVFKPVEKVIYRICGIDAQASQHWSRYAVTLLAFNAAGWVLLFAILRLQHLLPWNPAGLAPMSSDLAFNTAVSFVTNTNWQAYGGETSLSYFSQMVGLTMQNFVSASTGMAVAVAVIRGFAGRKIRDLGNFHVDMTRGVLYILLPLSIIAAIFLMSQGVPQNLNSYVDATTLEGTKQVLAQGPAASQIAIKQLGTNGGGFFNVNSSHPYENPTALSNLLQMVYILLIPAAFCFLFGKMVNDKRQGIAIFAVMAVLFVGGFAATYSAEKAGNALLTNSSTIIADPGNMEGKETRFGILNSTLWATATTAASNGSVNAMHDSLTPLGGMVTMLNMQLGEIVYGGVGAGFYGMLLFVVLTVFIAGLMVGRTPEYLGKKIEAREIKLAVLAILTMPIGILVFGALSATVPVAMTAVQDAGPHGLSEILYAYSSATGNNGSAFAGFGAGMPFQTTLQGIAMLLGRYGFIIPILAIAGSLGTKNVVPVSGGTFPTHGPLFVTLLIAVILIVGGLTFFPALALGPIAEHFAMLAGIAY
ncbi:MULTISPECIES: potassium-transporting ATPase subunit KdpA [Thalassospira]|jgi:K+-transporting ATPase ATPase A chain|uniref:Potassium-transporting ATPase potassium-binding subunit n=1 Tax=Thalassospira xiamenensis TaxID=220697 RepID=A0ABR5Y0V1_9PROT|nr:MULTISPECIES: potassium-transporting ATPase subunit KdpA [Thalassospira]KZD03200.1 ATPase [Thalassospira xiamenensis]KZD06016.1 ATPase [Thalassospira xiamenensis]MAB35537.1 potassium-transporting ATPase subunit KdpA [Thalassospira sp.]MAL28945.1 potassium-transporting ATPase subunit KdpA [Thalassospira sp.]MBA05694.1 potassium-transporting ATPase subunit KdpA [Thalassospira sp.]|tara:strand:+ start:3214 stop:4923 length:1710 start_codon:yes stop_codon:yes gene_type:complete